MAEICQNAMCAKAHPHEYGSPYCTGEKMTKPGTDVQKWADAAMFEAEPMQGNKTEDGHAMPSVHLLWATPDPLGAVAAMYRMYEGKPTYDLMNVSDEERRYYWGEAMKSHLGAPMEAIKLHFFVEGIDRAISHQQVRQRTAVFAQESLRFAVKNNLAAEVPLPPTMLKGSIEAGVWEETIERIEEAYNYLVNAGIPAEDARGLLPHATPTRLNWVTDMSNLVYHAGNRLCTQAQFMWRIVFAGVVNAIQSCGWMEYRVPTVVPGEPDVASSGWQFKHIAESDLFRPVCFRLGRCPWGEEMARPCSIRERVQEGKFDEIDPAEWLLDPNATRKEQ